MVRCLEKLTLVVCRSIFRDPTPHRESIRDLPTRLDPSLLNGVQAHLSALTETGVFGLSPLHLLEAHAMLGEIWTLASRTRLPMCVRSWTATAPTMGIAWRST